MTHFFENIELKIPKGVYEPREDTYLLLESVKSIENKKILEMGTGSGLISIYLSKKNKVTAIDINKNALKTAKKNAKNNKSKINFKYSNLFSNIFSKFDTILFNPPYVPKSIEDMYANEKRDFQLNKKDLEKFIKNAKNYLKKGGSCFIVFSSITPKEFIINLLKKHRYKYKIVNKKKIYWETLFVAKFSK